jgi:SP family xylose:H+ symportor-like MFS transporter
LVNLAFTLLAMWQVDRLGRRPLMLIGALGLSISFIVLAFLLQSHAPVILISIFVMLAIGVYSFSLAPVTWVLISEIFPNKVRGAASTLACGIIMGGFLHPGFYLPYTGRKNRYLRSFLPVRSDLFPGVPLCKI